MGRKRKFEINDNYFDIINTQEKAYIFGLLCADGCNYESAGVVKIDLIKDDEDLLSQVKDELEYTGELHSYAPLKKKFGDEWYDCKGSTRLIFHSHKISKQLALKGCVSNKSGILKFPEKDIISEDLLSHFIRGYMDESGTVTY